MAQSVNDENFESEVLKSGIPVLVDFWAEWCGPCKLLSPTMDEIAKIAEGKAKIVKVNVDDCPKTSAKYEITSIPTTILFEKGEVKRTDTGMLPKSEYLKILGL